MMTQQEFRDALATLGVSQREFARVVGVDDRTVRRWALGEAAVPRWTRLLLDVLAKAPVDAWASYRTAPAPASAARARTSAMPSA